MTEQADILIKQGHRAILDAAAGLFSERGYAATSLRDIAERAGMKAGSLYYHFSSKDEIVAEVIEFGVLAVAEEVANALDLAPRDQPVARLRAAIGGHLRSLLELHTYASANIRIYGELPQGLRARTHAARANYDAIWRLLIDDCAAAGQLRPDVDPSVLRLLLIGAMNGALQWRQPHGRLDVNALADAFAEIVLFGACRSRR
jgi:AcrR family transcriptional regulator